MLLPAHAAMLHVREHAMFLLDRHGRATSWSEGVLRVLGWNADDWLGQPLRVLFVPEDVAAGVPEGELAQAAETGRADDDRWLVRRDGVRFYAAGGLTRIDDEQGGLLGFVKVLRDMTPLLQAEQERERLLGAERAARADAERQAAALTAAINSIPDGVYIGTADGINTVNAPGLAMLGANSLQDLQARVDELGRRFRVRREREGALLDAAELPFARALRGEVAELDTWATRPDGKDVFIRGTAAPIRIDGNIIGAVAVNSDQTGRLQREQQARRLERVETALRESQEQLRALVEGVRDYAIFTIDPDGKISSWHIGAALMKGYSVEEAIGMPFENLFTPEERQSGQPSHEMAVAARTGEFKGEGLRLRKDGTTFEAHVVLTALRGPHGELLGYLKLTQDITERKARDRERDEALIDAQAARAEAERANRSKSDFLATISHELRTPLGAILGWARLLQRGVPDEAAVGQGLAAITRNARAQVQLIEDLLDMSRIESGQMRLDVQRVELAGIIAAALDAVQPNATAKGIALRTVIDPNAGAVDGDPERLQQIVANLLGNAIKFTPRGGRVTVMLAATEAAMVELSVSDTGQGIEPAFLARVFDRFQQEDASSTRRYGGLGLGLSIVRQLALLHGGSVRAESPGPGRGATFTVLLPARQPERGTALVAAPPQEADHPPPPPAAAPDPTRLERVAVLLIDDEVDARQIAEKVLQSAGATVLPAAGAREGWDLYVLHGADVVLCDIAMPEHDGYDFIRWLRDAESATGERTPAAAFTAYARSGDRERSIDAGYQSHLVKPLEPQALVDAVAELAGR